MTNGLISCIRYVGVYNYHWTVSVFYGPFALSACYLSLGNNNENQPNVVRRGEQSKSEDRRC